MFFTPENELKPHDKKVEPGSKSLANALDNPKDDEFVKFIKSCFEW